MPPRGQSLQYLSLPLVESGKLYRPASLARRIVNLEPTPEGTLRSIRGPVPYESHWQGSFGAIYGIYHSSSLGGANDLLLVRAGSTLYRHAGWARGWVTVQGGLNDEDRQKYPDTFTEINGRVIWCNGVDRPRVVNSATYYGSHDYPLGFVHPPSAPSVRYPTTSETSDSTEPPNYSGYSVPGPIGTVGDTYEGQQGNLLAGIWLYSCCFEDFDGNLSPMSSTVAASVKAQSTRYLKVSAPEDGTVVNARNILDDLTHSFYVTGMDDGPDHVAYVRLYRTPDTRHGPSTPHLVARLPGRNSCPYPDSISDGLLQAAPVAEDVVGVHAYRVSCEYQGRLVVGNTVGNPGMIRFSQPGFPGTWHRDDWVVPDASGAEITGLLSMGRTLLAFTQRATYSVSYDAEGLRSEPISKTIGCVAPQSVVGLEDGSVVWLGRDGFYKFDGESISRISDEIVGTVSALNQGRVGRCVAYYDLSTREYRCAVPYGAGHRNDRWLCYSLSTGGWRELDLGLDCNAVAVTNDDRRYPLAGLYDSREGGTWDVYVIGHESATWDPPLRQYLYSSADIRMGPDQTGLTPFTITRLLIGFVESDSETTLTVRTYRDGRSDTAVTTTCKLVDHDFEGSWAYGSAVLGTDIFRDPKISWARVDVDATSVSSFRFELEATGASYLHLHGVAVLGGVVDTAGGRTPMSTWSEG